MMSPNAVQEHLRTMLREIEFREYELRMALTPDLSRPLDSMPIALPTIITGSASSSHHGAPGRTCRTDGFAGIELNLGTSQPRSSLQRLRSAKALPLVLGLVLPGVACVLAGAWALPSAPQVHWAYGRLHDIRLATEEALMGAAPVELSVA